MAESEVSGGGQSALAVSTAHLTTLLNAIEGTSNRAMFMVGLNVASNSLFVAVIASLAQPWWSAVAPVILAFLAVSVGLWMLRARVIVQFPSPDSLRQFRDVGLSDDELAWELVSFLGVVVADVDRALMTLARGGAILYWMTVLDLATIGVISLLLVS